MANSQIHHLREYFLKKSETSPLHNAIVNIDLNYSPLNLKGNRNSLSLPSKTDLLNQWSCKIVHQHLANEHNLLKVTTPYYQYEPSPVLENDTAKLCWDLPVTTDPTILANRPDIILINKSKKTAFLIDLAHPNDHNLSAT